MGKNINRLKVVLAEKKRTNKWCTNTTQPSLEMLMKIAKVLEVDVNDLLRKQPDL